VQKSRESDLQQIRLDIALTASNAFLNLLRARTFERINKENLKRTKANLEMARVRESVGSAGPSEIFRWESELANNRNSVLQIIAEKNIAWIQLNRILQRDLKERINIIEANPYSIELSKSDNIFKKYLQDPKYFTLLQDYMVNEGLKNSPELAAIDYALNARSRAVSSANNRFWMPTLALQAEYGTMFAKSGAGSDPSASIPGISLPDDNIWNVGLNISLPLFEGTKRVAEQRQASEELEQLHLERRSLAQKIEQQIRSILYKVYASFSSINQTRLASQAANKSLEVVQEGYARGMVSILDLLDAQNTALVSEELASNAVYDFIADLLTAERSIGKFYLELNKNDAKEYFSDFEVFLSESGD
jgi:outer membrane protein TolC